MSPSDWTIITVTFNSREHLLTCWADVELDGAEWIVVDNASTDDSVAVATRLGAMVVARDVNDGFSRANNVGLTRVRTPWVMFVNPDVVIRSGHDLERLAAVAAANDGLVAPQLLNADGSEQLNARGLPFPGNKLAHRGLRVPGVQVADYARGGFLSPTYVAWAMGAAIGGRTTTFREMGGWDERYFIYYEDHDIGLRAWRAGHPVVLDPGVRWTHLWQRATTRASLGPWKHELASMRTFYSTYPGLVWRRLPTRSRHLRDLPARLWRPAHAGDDVARRSMMTRNAGLVVMAVHRPDPELLARQIESLRAQTLESWTCHVGLDGPDPAASALLTDLVAGDHRFCVREYPENVGVYGHVERLLSDLPDGVSWVALADQDDVWHPTKLARLTEALQAPGVTAAMCQARLVDPAGQLLGVTNRRASGLHDLLLRNQVTGSLTVFTADVVRRSLPFPAATGEAIHDHWLGVCAAALGEVRLVGECLQDYVQHPGNLLGDERATPVKDVWESSRAPGGVREHLDHVARDQWGWRVSMARGLESAGLVDRSADHRFLAAVAEGRFSAIVVGEVLASWLRGCMRARGLASTLVGAWWFSTRCTRRSESD